MLSKHSALVAFVSLSIISCLVPLAGCGGGAQATQSTPTGPVSGSEFVYFIQTGSEQSAAVQMASLDPASGTLGSFNTVGDAISDLSFPYITNSLFSSPSGKNLYSEANLGDTEGAALLAFSIGV